MNPFDHYFQTMLDKAISRIVDAYPTRQQEIPITIKKLSMLTGLPISTIHNYRKENVIRAHRIGGKYLVYPSEFNEDIKTSKISEFEGKAVPLSYLQKEYLG